MTPVPTEHTNTIYRKRDGSEVCISDMDAYSLMVALYDMLMRKAKHNQKLNKMLEVGEVLSGVTKAIHLELGKRQAELTDLPNLQAMADLGRLKLQEDDTSVSLTTEE